MYKRIFLLLTSGVCGLQVSAAELFGDHSQLVKDLNGTHGYLQLSNKDSFRAAIGHKLENGVDVAFSSGIRPKSKHHKFKTPQIGIAYRFDVSDNWWLKPSLVYTKHNSVKDTNFRISDSAGKGRLHFNKHQAKLYTVSLQSGYKFNNGFFLGTMYEYGRSKVNAGIQVNRPKAIENDLLKGIANVSGKTRHHRFKLTAGKSLSNVSFSASFQHLRSTHRLENNSNKTALSDIYQNSFTRHKNDNSMMFRITYEGFKHIQPYIQYSHHLGKKDNNIRFPSAYLNRKEAQVGVSFQF